MKEGFIIQAGAVMFLRARHLTADGRDRPRLVNVSGLPVAYLCNSDETGRYPTAPLD